MEIWKDIDGYEGLYQVSNKGRVKSLDKQSWNGHVFFLKKGKIRSLCNSNGYQNVSLSDSDTIKTTHYVHRLVASAFLPNPNNYPCVNHKDENKKNNTAENLEWCTHLYNVTYGTKIERSVANTDYQARDAKRKVKILQYTLKGELIKEWDSATDIQRLTGLKRGAILQSCTGKTSNSYGYIWRYLDEHPKGNIEIPNLDYKYGIDQYDLSGQFIRKWDNIFAASNSLRIDKGNIYSCVTGNKKTAGDYIWVVGSDSNG